MTVYFQSFGSFSLISIDRSLFPENNQFRLDLFFSWMFIKTMKNIWSHEDTKIYGCNAEERAVIDGLLAEESSFRDNGLNPVFVSKIVIFPTMIFKRNVIDQPLFRWPRSIWRRYQEDWYFPCWFGCASWRKIILHWWRCYNRRFLCLLIASPADWTCSIRMLFWKY